MAIAFFSLTNKIFTKTRPVSSLVAESRPRPLPSRWGSGQKPFVWNRAGVFHRKRPCLSFSSIKDQFPGKWVEFSRWGGEKNEFSMLRGSVNLSVDGRSHGENGRFMGLS